MGRSVEEERSPMNVRQHPFIASASHRRRQRRRRRSSPGPADEPQSPAAGAPTACSGSARPSSACSSTGAPTPSIGREEWARQLLQIPLEEYRDMAPDNFDPGRLRSRTPGPRWPRTPA
ncbi:MAG: hypothetical protein MZV64_14415 [Ignavibacteriales bacterium]|nr:hypothetical protein [Ignavibacteriales bacterium]